MKVYLVVDEYQYDGGYIVLGIHKTPNKALEHMQKTKFHIWHDGQSKGSYSYEMDVVE